MDTTYSWGSGELRLHHFLYIQSVFKALSGRCAYQICCLYEVKRENIICLIPRFVQRSLMKWKGEGSYTCEKFQVGPKNAVIPVNEGRDVT